MVRLEFQSRNNELRLGNKEALDGIMAAAEAAAASVVLLAVTINDVDSSEPSMVGWV
jgi:hypothetical protein